jgi:hypothetical protein
MGQAPRRRPAKASKVSAARQTYGVPGVAVADERRSVPSSVLALLILVVGLAVATIWFVALPAFGKPLAKRSCEVVVLESGATRCVADPTSASRAVQKRSKPRPTHALTPARRGATWAHGRRLRRAE